MAEPDTPTRTPLQQAENASELAKAALAYDKAIYSATTLLAAQVVRLARKLGHTE